MGVKEEEGTDERLLFVVEEAFRIEDRGTILTPGFLPEVANVRPFKRLPVRLRRPDGSFLEVPDAEVAIALNLKNPRKPVLIRGVSKDDVPKGTEVWYVGGAVEHEDENQTS